MRNKKRLLKMICLIVLTFIISVNFGGCAYYGGREANIKMQYNIIKDGNLTYYQDKKTDEYHLVENNEEKNNSDVWHINPYYNEYEVAMFGVEYVYGMLGGGYLGPSLYNIEEVSLPYCMQMSEGVTEPCSATEMKWPTKFIVVNNESNDDVKLIYLEGDDYEDEGYIREIFVSAYSYTERVSQLKHYYKRYLGDTKVNDIHNKREVQLYEYSNGKTHCITTWDGVIEYNFKICKANTSYLFNYEDCPNDGYFFINDFEYGKTIENIPYEPLRAGYTFGGWYKESECINAWDFETDTLPQAQYNEDGQELYQETKLYAKWIKQ